MPALFDDALERILEEDQFILSRAQFPIVTVSASFRDLVEIQHAVVHPPGEERNLPDVVFSRAHYSMALAIAVAAWGPDAVDRSKAWLIDPTNYVTSADWSRIEFSQTVGRRLARHGLLGWLKKNIIDKYGRKKLPITKAITPPLLYLTEQINRPIISVHDQAGNILADTGKTIVQVITDPFVRPEYLHHAQLPTMHYCVFDENTRLDFLEMAADMGKEVDPERVVVTGPPVDPRIVAAREHKSPTAWQERPLRVLLTTGGLGTNRGELRDILHQLLPLARRKKFPVQLIYYAGTNQDHDKMVRRIAKDERVGIGKMSNENAPLRILYADDVVQANQQLIVYGFPWADLIITKPSGDMAYDAVAAGSAVLFLSPWGSWEKNIHHHFVQLNLARPADPKNIAQQLKILTNYGGASGDQVWLAQTISKALSLPSIYLRGAQNILTVARRAGK